MTDPAALLSQAVADRYRLGDMVGRGGMSAVYRAHDLRHDRPVAIKVFTQTVGYGGAERFLREIGFLARLHHPHILPLLDSGSAEGLLYYVMPLVEGESLRDRMSREPRLPLPEALRLTIEVCDALRYAHSQGVIHRDIKPENILLVDRHAVVADFGVARAVRPGDTGSSYTTAGLAVGTPAYMSPEQAAADPQIDHRADLYALGIVAYEMLGGEPPFAGDSPQVILAAHVTTPPRNLAELRPDLPPDLCAVIMRCLTKRAADRWPDAGVLREALELYLVPSGSVTPVPMAPVLRRRRRMQIAGAALAVAAIGLVTWRLLPAGDLELRLGEPRRLGVATELELDPAISPDGRMVAYAGGRPGAMQIRVRQLAGGEPVTVAEGVRGSQRWPRWSSDGTRLSFQSEGAVHEVPALGGAARTIVAGTPGVPAGDFSPSPDGTRVAYTSGGAIRVRPAAGGEARELVRDFTAHSLAWSPDGRWIAYVSGNAEFVFSEVLLGNVAPSTLTLVSVDGGEPTSLTDGATLAMSPAWLGTHVLAYVGGGGATRDLFALRLTRGGRRVGAPTRLTTGLRMHGVSAVPGGSELAYVNLDHVANVWTIPRPLPGDPVFSIREGHPFTEGDQVVEDMDVFPVGGMVLFDSNRDGNQDIWLQSGPGTSPVALTSDPADEFGPVWSPNGREVAYYSVRDGVRHLFVMGIAGQNPVQVTSSDTLQDQQPQWSPDGNSLVFYRRDPSGRDRISITTRSLADSTWGEPRLVTDEPGTGADWSSDGRWIAFTDPAGNLRVVEVDGGPSRILARPEDVGGFPIRRPHWLMGEPALLARVEGPSGTGGIWRFSIMADAPAELVRLDDPDRPVYRTDFVADGSRIYLLVSQFSSGVWRIAVTSRP
jgi:serine/threonine-protein kinase